MRKHLLISLVTLVAVLCGVSFALGAEVAQGKCVKIEREGTLVTIEEYDTQFSKEHPYGRPTGIFSFMSTSFIGILAIFAK